MHGTGNDFIMINNFDQKIELRPEKVKAWCDRNFGIGADGVIALEPSKTGDVFMNYWNSDGSLAENCGNGVRCVARFMKDFVNFKGEAIQIQTRAGIKDVQIQVDNHYAVNMGTPEWSPHRDFVTDVFFHEGFEWHSVSMGNPHAIGVFASETEIEKYFVKIGSFLEGHKEAYPHKVNVTFVCQRGENHFYAKTYERGCGPTLACGTAASGAYAVLYKLGLASEAVQIDVPGGLLKFTYNGKEEVIMSGPSTVVFMGEIEMS